MSVVRLEHDYSVSFVRFVAILMIVACHIFQYFDNSLAWWFNVGVQLFLVISGYLYSTKKIESYIGFIKKQVVKLLVDYFIVVVGVVCVACCFSKEINKGDIIRLTLLFGPDDFVPLKHLWFIRYILICYLILPILQQIMDWCETRKNSVVWLLFMSIGIQVISLVYIKHLDVSLINAFVFGMIIRRLELTRLSWRVNIFIIAVALAMNTLRIVVDYDGDGITYMVYDMFCKYAHVMLATSLFILIRYLYERALRYKLINLLAWSDIYSYDIYLVHHIFILGCFSIYYMISNIYLATIIVCGFTIGCAIMVHILSKRIKMLFNKNQINL